MRSHSEREEAYKAIANMEVIFPALAVLEEKETEIAATTNMVSHCMATTTVPSSSHRTSAASEVSPTLLIPTKIW
jgi:hypothetical protein